MKAVHYKDFWHLPKDFQGALQTKPIVFRRGGGGKVPERKDLLQLTQSESRGGSPGPGLWEAVCPVLKDRAGTKLP